MRAVGVVPAAGRSTRMGSPKPLLDANGRSFLGRVVAALKDGGAHEVFVGVRERKGPVAAEALSAGARVLVPADVEDGPIATVRAAILEVEQARSDRGPETGTDEGSDDPPRRDIPDGLLLHPVDHPLVTAETVGRLLSAAESAADPAASPSESDRPALVVVPEFREQTGHPIFLHRSLFPELLEPDLSEGARTVVHRHRDRTLRVPVEDRGVLADLNTLVDYRRHFPDAYRKRFQKW